MSRTLSCVPPASAIKVPLERTLSVSGIPPCEDGEDDDQGCQEAIHRNQKRARENMVSGAGVDEGVDPNLFSPPREAKLQAVRRLEYTDADDILGQIARLPDDNAVEQEPHMSQAWNQDQSGSSQGSQDAVIADHVDHAHELEEGEIIIQSQMPIAG